MERALTGVQSRQLNAQKTLHPTRTTIMNKGKDVGGRSTRSGYSYHHTDPGDGMDVDYKHQDSCLGSAYNTPIALVEYYQLNSIGDPSCTSTFVNESSCDFTGRNYRSAPGQSDHDLYFSNHKETTTDVPSSGFKWYYSAPQPNAPAADAYHTGINNDNMHITSNNGDVGTPGSTHLLHSPPEQIDDGSATVPCHTRIPNRFQEDDQPQLQPKNTTMATTNSALPERGRRFSDRKEPHAFRKLPGVFGRQNDHGLLDCFSDCSNRRYGGRGSKRRGNLLQHLRDYHGQKIPNMRGLDITYYLRYFTQ